MMKGKYCRYTKSCGKSKLEFLKWNIFLDQLSFLVYIIFQNFEEFIEILNRKVMELRCSLAVFL